jgi:hypothetical protein
MGGVLVLVTGTGRSGTSTISGTLHHLGLAVPGPFLGANKSNPNGFFESTWAVEFHQKIARAAYIEDFDSRPESFELAQRAITPQLRAELVEWISDHAELGPQLVVKDPRSVWVQGLWREAAAEVGLEIRYITMLRHPAEVVGSRATYYAKKADEVQRRRYEVSSTARWLHHSLMSERHTRGEARSFVPYDAMLEDWRSVMANVRDDLGLSLNDNLQRDHQHAVDEFIDPGLRRVRVTWDDLNLPQGLQVLTQSVWDELTGMRENADQEAVQARLDKATEDYERLFIDSAAIAHDEVEGARRAGRRAGAAQARKDMKSAQAAAAKRAPAPTVEDRLVRDVPSATLLRSVASRLRRRLRR